MANDFDVLEQFTVVDADDEPDHVQELVCDNCGRVVCGIDEGDSLAMIANAADKHWRERHGSQGA